MYILYVCVYASKLYKCTWLNVRNIYIRLYVFICEFLCLNAYMYSMYAHISLTIAEILHATQTGAVGDYQH